MKEITVQFPQHTFYGQCELISESSSELITKFFDANKEEHLLNMLAEFYAFGANYFRNENLSGEDVAAKLRLQLGEIWLNNKHYTGVWPHSVNFGELCYSSDDTVDLEITWKFKDAYPI